MLKSAKKSIAMILSVVMMLGVLSAFPAMPAHAAPEDGLIFHLDFDNNTTTPQVGQATQHGTWPGGAFDEGVGGGRAAVLTSGRWLSLMGEGGAPLLAGLTEYTASLWFNRTDRAASWWFFAAPNANPQTWQNEHYVGLLSGYGGAGSDNLMYQRFLAGRGAPSSTATAPHMPLNEWVHAVVVHRGDSSTIYIDGNEVTTIAGNAPLTSILGGSPVVQIGRANWGGGGEFARGRVDDIRVYNRALSSQEVLSLYAEHVPAINLVEIPNVLPGDFELPTTVIGEAVTWTASDPAVLAADGRTIVAGATDRQVVLTATTDSQSRTFAVTILGPDSRAVFAYTTAMGGLRRGASMHLAMEIAGEVTPLNFNLGVLYANAQRGFPAGIGSDWLQDFRLDRRVMLNPWIFRMSDGTIGVVAQNAFGLGGQEGQPADMGQLSFWTTDDLINFDWHGLVTVAAGEHITSPQVFYENGQYYITWMNGAQVRQSSAASWDMPGYNPTFRQPANTTTFTPAADSTRARAFPGQNVDGGVVSCGFSVTAAEAQYLSRRLIEVKNYRIEPIDAVIELGVGDTFSQDALPETIRAYYTDTSTNDIPIVWDEGDIAAIDTAEEGFFTIRGQAAVSDYPFPIIPARADPSVVLFEGMYYFIATRDTFVMPYGFQRVFQLRGSETLSGLATAPDVTLYCWQDFNRDFHSSSGIFRPNFWTTDEPNGGNFWAPELQVIDGQLRILSAISPNHHWGNVQSIIMTLEADGDPLNRDDWSRPYWILQQDGVTPLTANAAGDSVGISLDMSYLYENGVHYYIWSARHVGGGAPFNESDANLTIATFCPTDPTVLTSDPVILTRPMPSWANVSPGSPVDEGPFVLRSPEGRIFMAVSGSGTDETYAITFMEARPGTDAEYGVAHLLDPGNWTRGNFPVLATRHLQPPERPQTAPWVQPGPGHNTFVRDEFGRDVIVFHSGTGGSYRHTGFRTVHWGYGGYPILYMTADRYLLPQYREVTVEVFVGDSPFSEISLPARLPHGFVLPTTSRGQAVIWSASPADVLAEDGRTIVGGEYEREAILTAQIGTETRGFTRIILPVPAAEVMVYTTNRFAGHQVRNRNLHLAMEIDGVMTPLNFNHPILFTECTPYISAAFPRRNYTSGTSWGMINPWLFRMSDGTIGLVGQRTNHNNNTDTASGQLLFYTTTDLERFERHGDAEGLVQLVTGQSIAQPQVAFDSDLDRYIISWMVGATQHEASTADWIVFTSYGARTTKVRTPQPDSQGVLGAIPSQMFELTREEAEFVLHKYGETRNTHIDPVEDITAPVGTPIAFDELPWLTAHYTDTSTGEVPVVWDENVFNAIDWNTPGVYQIPGVAQVGDWPWPFIMDRADPTIIRYKGAQDDDYYFYFVATYDTAHPPVGNINRIRDGSGYQERINIRRSRTLEGLAGAEERSIFICERYLKWAPELHVVDGRLSLLFAIGTGWDTVQSHIMTLRDGGDPMNRDDWNPPVMVTKSVGATGGHAPNTTFDVANYANRIAAPYGFAIDMTYFQIDGVSYYMWSQRPETPIHSPPNQTFNSRAVQMIAPVDPANSARILGEPIQINEPLFGWTGSIDEGAFMLRGPADEYGRQREFIMFCGSGVGEMYSIGVLEFTGDPMNPENRDPLNSDHWLRTQRPILTRDRVEGQYATGHASFIQDEFGRDIIVFHARDSATESDHYGRHTLLRVVHWGFDGMPVLYMTPDRLLLPQYRNPVLTIVVGDDTPQARATGDANMMRAQVPVELIEHITLPLVGPNGSTVAWQSSNENLVTAHDLAGDVVQRAGIVNRNEGGPVVLTATATYHGAAANAVMNTTVRTAAPCPEDLDVHGGYLYAFFRGSIFGLHEEEQVHFAISEDGLNWRELNGNRPVITSHMGTGGLRDMHMLRIPGNDKVYLIATDLNVFRGLAGGSNWGNFNQRGSRSIMVWESYDLVNWSPQRKVQVASDDMGCAWAPEAIYDPYTGEYLVYFSAPTAERGWNNGVWVVRTRDFVNFSEPELFVGENNARRIDTTMAQGDDGRFFRLTKNEDSQRMIMEAADRPQGLWAPVTSNIGDVPGVEGPAMFRQVQEDRWVVMLDQYAAAGNPGFIPFVTDRLEGDNVQFTPVPAGEFRMPHGAKHGGIIPITRTEFDAIMAQWGPYPDIPLSEGPALHWTFDDNMPDGRITDVSGNGNHGFARGNATAPAVTDRGRVLDLPGGTAPAFAQFPIGFFDNRENATISFDVFNRAATGNRMEFHVGNRDILSRMYLRLRSNEVHFAQGLNDYPTQRSITVPGANPINVWTNFTIVMEGNRVRLYRDGERIGSERTDMLTFAQFGIDLFGTLGYSPYGGDPYSNAQFDNVKVFWNAMTSDEVYNMLNPAMYEVRYTVTGTLAPVSFTPADPSTLNHEAQTGTTVTVAPKLETAETTHESVPGTWAFSGWTTTDATVDEGGEFTMPRQDVVFTGQWVFTPAAEEITVIFDLNPDNDPDTDSAVIPPQTILVGETVDEPLPEPTREGYVFQSWHRETEGHLILNERGAARLELFDFATPLYADTTLVAVWEPLVSGDHTITWALVGGAWSGEFTPPATVADGGTIAAIAEADLPTRDGFTFAGWAPELPLEGV
ncbi:MAG: family 43 glycosylhydrolase, partial [Oscillospiraceae bacterium]|nr:family 43 glycosylhydrolase [Oscillospiraceae bacterium]